MFFFLTVTFPGPPIVEPVWIAHGTFFFEWSPTLQLLDLKKIAGKSGADDRYRLVISDAQHYMQAMLATQLNGLAEQGQVEWDGGEAAEGRGVRC